MQQSKPKGTKPNNQSKGSLRIIGGSMRGRKLRFESVEGLRPTLDRIRETLFNWLARDIAEAHCLDLFAGSGALGFEAASRGAGQVTLVERNAKVALNLKKNCTLLDTQKIKVTNLEAAHFLKTNQKKFDLVFLDPPFGKGLLSQVMDSLISHLNPDALLYIEQEKSQAEFVPDQNWQQLKYKTTGSFSYALYQLNRTN